MIPAIKDIYDESPAAFGASYHNTNVSTTF